MSNCAFTRLGFVFAALVMLLAPVGAAAQQYCPEAALESPYAPIVVGTKFSPPFVMGPKDAPEGVAIDLLRLIVDCVGLTPEDLIFVEFGTAAELIDAASNGSVDIAISTLQITVEDEARVDFSFPYFDTRLAVFKPNRERMTNIGLLLARIFQSNVLFIILGMIGFMVALAIVYWRVERQNGNEFFEGGPFRGLMRSFIWSALLVFRGSSDPYMLVSQAGQIFVLILMLLGVGVVSSFTAIITSSMTLQALQPEVRSLSDLDGLRVSVLSDSKAAEWAQEAGVNVRPLRTFSQVQRYFDEGEIDIFVHEEAVVRYLINNANLKQVKRAPLTMAPHRYAFAYPPDGALREPVNRALLSVTETEVWKSVLHSYFR